MLYRSEALVMNSVNGNNETVLIHWQKLVHNESQRYEASRGFAETDASWNRNTRVNKVCSWLCLHAPEKSIVHLFSSYDQSRRWGLWLRVFASFIDNSNYCLYSRRALCERLDGLVALGWSVTREMQYSWVVGSSGKTTGNNFTRPCSTKTSEFRTS